MTRRRGGYCYELNALFTRLLLDLGFDARSVFCRVVRGRDFLPPCTHRAIAVELEGRLYFCDVGFGGPMPAGALEIRDGLEAVVRGEAFRIDRFDEYWWLLSRTDSEGRREAILQFTTFPQLPQEFIAANRMSATDLESLFVRQLIVNLRTEDSSRSLSGHTLTVRDASGTRKREIPDTATLKRILKEYFGIEAPGDQG